MTMDDASGKDKFRQVVLDLGRSGLIASFDDTLRVYHDRAEAEQKYPTQVTDLGCWLIARDLVTSWQFENIRKGRWQGFFELPGYRLLDHLEIDQAYSYYLVERIDTGRRAVARVTPKARSKVPGATEFKIVPEFPRGLIAMIKRVYGRSIRKRKFAQVVKDLGRSRLIEPFKETLRAFHDRPEAEQKYPTAATDLGRWLIGHDLITHWQFRMLCEGKWKGFFIDGYKLLDHLDGRSSDGHYLAECIATRVRVVLRVTGSEPLNTAPLTHEVEHEVEHEFR
ncbi:MAG TPA: hypothetical protein VGG30_04520 [Pirellulales bacterium]